jgi:hypothetical protein
LKYVLLVSVLKLSLKGKLQKVKLLTRFSVEIMSLKKTAVPYCASKNWRTSLTFCKTKKIYFYFFIFCSNPFSRQKCNYWIKY